MGDLVTATFELRDEGDQILSSGHESKRFMTGNDLVFPMRMKLPDGIDAASAHVSIVIKLKIEKSRPPVKAPTPKLVPQCFTIDNKPVWRSTLKTRHLLWRPKRVWDVVC